jgi:hypothetical protein
MGYLNNLAKKQKSFVNAATAPSRALWQDVFGDAGVIKETIPPPTPPGGSWGRSTVSSDNAFKRLVQAMRSNAPGGWSDDRWEQSRHFTGIAYVAIHRQNELLTQAEFQIYEKDPSHPDGMRPANSAGAKALADLLEKPNSEDSFGDVLANINLQMDLTGKALLWMVPNGYGTPFEIYSIPNCLAIPQPVVNPDYPNGYYRIQPVYPYGPFSSYPTPASAVGAAIPAEWMIEFKYPHPILRYDGYSPLTALRLHLDEIESMDRSRWYSMKRNINPSAVLSFENEDGFVDLPEAEVERIRAEFENEHQGPENAGRLFVTSGKLSPFGTSPRDMDYQSGWDQLTSFALGGFGVTKPAAGMVDDSSYASLYAALKQLYWLTLNPKVDRIARKLTRVLAPHFGENLIVVIRCKRIDDEDITFKRLDKGLQGKCITKNELRKMIDLPVTQEMWGEQIAGIEDLASMQGLPPGAAPNMMPGQMPGEVPPDMNIEAQILPNQNPNQLEESGMRDVDFDMIGRGQPEPEKVLSGGSLGPRKSLNNYKKKSMYDMTMEVLSNGHH